MGITKTVLKRPVTTVMVILCLIVFGLQSVMSSKLDLMPDMEMPMLVINSIYPGASPEDVNDLVTKEIEDEIGTLSGIKEINSTSMENASIVIIQYEYGTDIDEAYDDLKKKIDAMEADLPDDCESPVIMELDLDEQACITLTVNHASEGNLYDYVDNTIVPEIEKLSSVADVDVSGGQESYIKIQVIPEKLEQYHLTMNSVASAIGSADFSYPAGDTDVGGLNLSVSVESQYDTVELLKQIPIALGNGSTIYLEDVANIGTNLEEQTGIARYNGEDTISIGVKKQQSASAIQVSEAVTSLAEDLMAEDPNLEIVVVDDQSDMIQSSLQSVAQTMVMAVVISMVIIFLFYGEIRASLIVGTSIPVSILVALILMSAMGFTLNVVTLSSLVLGVGMMVDNSIVVLESCFEHTRKNGSKGIAGLREAALEGTKSVLSSVIGSTVTTCVVFLPLALISGLSGQMFKPLGFTIVFCMVASLLSAMTVVPLCYCTFRPKEKKTSPGAVIIGKCQNVYRKWMRSILKSKKLVMLISVGLLIFSFWMASQLLVDLMPDTDQGEISVTIETRPGLKIEELDQILQQVEKIVVADEDVESYLLTTGGSGISLGDDDATLTAYLKDDRKRKTDEVIKDWEPLMDAIPGTNISLEKASAIAISMSSDSDMEVILQSTQYDTLKSVSDQIADELKERPELTKVHTTLENAAPVVKVKVDAVKANAENIQPLQIYAAVNAMIDGTEASSLDVDGNDMEIRVEYAEDEYDTIDKLSGIVLTSNSGASVALTDVAEISFKDSPTTITRKDKQYQVTISGKYLTDDVREQEAVDQLLYDEVISKYLSATVTMGTDTVDTMQNEEFGTLFQAIGTAAFLVFVVMAAQFESPKFSFMVMTTIPFALIGSFGLLYITDVPISMISLLGFLILCGTVVNNGILYVDTVNQYKLTMNRTEALIEAGATRMRPIMMTTLTTVVSMIPMAMAYGDNGEIMQGLALVDVGGLVASTVMALFVLPVYYAIMSPERKKEPDYD